MLLLVFAIGRAEDGKPVYLPFFAPVILFFLLLLATSRTSFDINTSRFEMWIWFFSFLAFYLLVNVLETTQDVQAFFSLTGVAVIPLVIYCVWEHPSLHRETHATLINSALLAGFAQHFLLFFGTRWKEGWRFVVLCLCSILLILFAKAWWSYISLVIGFAYYQWPWLRRHVFRSRLQLGMGALGCGLLFFLVLWDKLAAYPLSYAEGLNRWHWWIVAFRMYREHPLVGIGLGAYGTAFAWFKTPGDLNTLFAHSFPLQIMSELGISGLVFFVGFLIYLSKLFRYHRRNARLFQATLLVLLCYSVVTLHMDYFLNKLLFLIILACLHVKTKMSAYLWPRYGWVAVSGLLVLSIPVWSNYLSASQWYVNGLRSEVSLEYPAAQEAFQRSIALNPSLAEAYWGLSRIQLKTYRETHSRVALSQSLMRMQQAMDLKKDYLYFYVWSQLQKNPEFRFPQQLSFNP